MGASCAVATRETSPGWRARLSRTSRQGEDRLARLLDRGSHQAKVVTGWHVAAATAMLCVGPSSGQSGWWPAMLRRRTCELVVVAALGLLGTVAALPNECSVGYELNRSGNCVLVDTSCQSCLFGKPLPAIEKGRSETPAGMTPTAAYPTPLPSRRCVFVCFRAGGGWRALDAAHNAHEGARKAGDGKASAHAKMPWHGLLKEVRFRGACAHAAPAVSVGCLVDYCK